MIIDGVHYDIKEEITVIPKIESLAVKCADGKSRYVDRTWVKLYSDVTFTGCDAEIAQIREIIELANGSPVAVDLEHEYPFGPNIGTQLLSILFVNIMSDTPVWQGYTDLTMRIGISGRITATAPVFPELDWPSGNTLRVSDKLVSGAHIDGIDNTIVLPKAAQIYMGKLILSEEQMSDLLDYYYDVRHGTFSYPLRYNIFDPSNSVLPTVVSIVDIVGISTVGKKRWECQITIQDET